MPIRIKSELPAREQLENENIFVMDEFRSIHQDIRALEIVILNLMPLKEDTELQILRSLSNSPLQVNITFLTVESHVSKNTSKNHLDQFYVTFSEIRDRKYDGMIITGAPVETYEFEEVDYWEELCSIFEWTKTHVTSTFHICWGAQAGLYYHYGLKKRRLNKKLFGVYSHRVKNRRLPLVRGFDDLFLIPHSRYTTVDTADIYNCSALTVCAESEEAGIFLCLAQDGKQIFVMGHPEYDRLTLDKEYRRDRDKGMDTALPKNYYPDDDPKNRPRLSWRSHANILYTNWLNYYVYQTTPYTLEDIGEVSRNLKDQG